FGVLEATLRGTTDYLTGALARHATPVDVGLDVLTWMQTATHREPPRCATDHTVVAEWPIARLRDFSDADAGDTTATLLLPPQAGHDSCIVDYDDEQSQVRTAKQ